MIQHVTIGAATDDLLRRGTVIVRSLHHLILDEPHSYLVLNKGALPLFTALYEDQTGWFTADVREAIPSDADRVVTTAVVAPFLEKALGTHLRLYYSASRVWSYRSRDGNKALRGTLPGVGLTAPQAARLLLKQVLTDHVTLLAALACTAQQKAS